MTMKIPYGISNFAELRSGGFFYADKTPFLPILESAELGFRHLVFLRPRRFGKSTLLSMMESYYDAARNARFDELFDGLWIHAHRTPEQGRYLVLSFDFSNVATAGGVESLEETFFLAVKGRVGAFLLRYRDRIPVLEDLHHRLDTYRHAGALIDALAAIIATTNEKLYVIIDEYDHFANRLLAGGAPDLYEAVVTKTGFVRTFYAALKSATGLGALGRMFITGVSPLMLDDLSSGFNISTNVSRYAGFNTLAGFTRADTERAVDELLASHPETKRIHGLGDRDALLDVLTQHYNGYRFSPQAAERVFNSDMVLYFLREVAMRQGYPESMLDRNVRTEYGHLQRIGTMSGTGAAERRALLESILSEGHIWSELVDSFGVKSLSSHAPFLSLLYYLGMLTLRATPRGLLGYDLEIPNRVIRELQWEHLALMFEEQVHVAMNLDELRRALAAMAGRGDITPFLDLFHAQVLSAFSVRDTRRLDEKALKLLIMMYASLGGVFHPLSEQELSQGYGDLFLGASTTIEGARFSWLLELKYLKTGATPAKIEAAFDEARAQVERYAADVARLPILLGKQELRAGMIVFVGTKRVLFRPFGAGAPHEVGAAPRRSARRRGTKKR